MPPVGRRPHEGHCEGKTVGAAIKINYTKPLPGSGRLVAGKFCTDWQRALPRASGSQDGYAGPCSCQNIASLFHLNMRSERNSGRADP